jgi:sugar lactone lactonase YvrE
MRIVRIPGLRWSAELPLGTLIHMIPSDGPAKRFRGGVTVSRPTLSPPHAKGSVMKTLFRRAALGAGAITTAAVLVASSLAPAAAADPGRGHDGQDEALAPIHLPSGFPPEGIAIEHGTAYLGSRTDGDIYALNLKTGKGKVISRGTPSSATCLIACGSLGLAIDSRRHQLYVAGGGGGDARVIDLRNGAVLAEYQLAPEGTSAFIDDVLLTDHGALFTDAFNDTLYRVRGGRVEKVPLRGEWVQTPEGFNANGITTTPDGRALLVNNSTTGELYRVEEDGASSRVDLGGQSLAHPDGLLREGRTLYAVQSDINAVAVVELDKSGTRGEVVDTLTSDDFDVPTAIARHGDRLYVPNARFEAEEAADTEYWLTVLKADRGPGQRSGPV